MSAVDKFDFLEKQLEETLAKVKTITKEMRSLAVASNDLERDPLFPAEAHGRIVPKWMVDLLPAHPIEFRSGDSDQGRSCFRCGFSVPSGMRYAHRGCCKS